MACMPSLISAKTFDRIVALRAAGWPQVKIAGEVGVGQATVSRVHVS